MSEKAAVPSPLEKMAERGPGDSLSGGEMGALIRAKDWALTPLGPIESWPQSLRTAVDICQASDLPICVIWGQELVQIYNDGYRVICGGKHPHSMGQNFPECWREAWPVIGQAHDSALAGDTAFLENQHIFLDRHGYTEECFFTFSFSPIRDEMGRVGGLFHPVIETTARMLGERRTRALRDLAARTASAPTVDEACTLSAESLAEQGADVPFALLYLFDADGGSARLAASAGLPPGMAARRERIEFASATPSWPLAEVATEGVARLVDDLEGRFGHLACGPYPESPRQALVLPITSPGVERPAGVLIAGLSSRLKLDPVYRDFLELLAAAVTTAVANGRAFEEERERAEALAELDRAKTAFFSNVSHEFRTPLTLLLGPAEEILSDPEIGSASRRRVEVIHRNALRLQKLVNTLLEFSQIEAGRAQAAYVESDLAELTADLASVFRSAMEKGGLQFTVDCPPLPAPVFVDHDMWEKIVLNLISNAFKFTLEGEVEVRLRPVRDGGTAFAELSVRDTGFGIPADQLTKVFDRFHRVENQRGRTHEGTGIGLALAHELVKLHGGVIRAESEPGHGTIFIVRLLFGKDHLAADRIVSGSAGLGAFARGDAYPGEARVWLPEENAAEPPGAPESRGLPRVLLAEDNADMREYLRRLLASRWEVEAVPNGAAALAAARANIPLLILSDVMMPGMNGFELLQAVRADVMLRATPVILLSARDGDEARVEGVSQGADDYLVKPFSARELIARVAAHIELARVRGDARQLLEQQEQLVRAANEELRQRVAELQAANESVQNSRRAALNLMADAVESRRQLEASNQALREREESLRESAEELARADRAKDEFLAMLAHELRNPLAPLRNAAEVLRAPAAGAAQRDHAQDVLDRQIENMSRMIDDLLDVSRITEGKIELRKSPVDLGSILSAAANLARSGVTARDQELVLKLPAEPVFLDADATRLEQVFGNLLTNACKYGGDGCHIEFSAERAGAEVVVSVRDNGVGIAPDLLPRVFELFVQSSRTLDRAHGGLGIGLTLVHRLVKLHGGSVEARSEGIGRGSEFIVRLPVLESPPTEPRTAASTKAGRRSFRMLIVDDNVDAAESLAMLQGLHGHVTRVEHSGPAGLHAAADFLPEVVLLDIGLPGMDGYEVARWLRGMAGVGNAFLVAMTGYGSERDRRLATEAGFDEHLVKPADLSVLRGWLESRG